MKTLKKVLKKKRGQKRLSLLKKRIFTALVMQSKMRILMRTF